MEKKDILKIQQRSIKDIQSDGSIEKGKQLRLGLAKDPFRMTELSYKS